MNNNIKRIGIDARFYGPIGKGLGRYTQEIADQVTKLDQANQYVIFLRAENYADFSCDGQRVKKVLLDVNWYGLAEQIIFPFYIWREHVDLMHFPHFNVPIFCPVKFVVTIHDLILIKFPTLRATSLGPVVYKIKNLAYRLVIYLAVKRARRVIAVSEFTKNDVIRHFNIKPEKVTVSYEGAASLTTSYNSSGSFYDVKFMKGDKKNEARKEVVWDDKNLLLSYNISEPFLLYVGNAYPHKNLEGLVDVFKKIKESLEIKSPIGDLISLPKLVLVGKEDYFYQRLKQYTKKIFVDNNKAVVFAGYVPDKDLAVFYRQALAYVFPSFYEGFGLPPLEAMANGCPVISSNQTSLPEILGQAAFYFNPKDQTEMEKKIEQVINNQKLRQELINRGYEQVKKYSWQDCAKKTLRIYEQILS